MNEPNHMLSEMLEQPEIIQTSFNNPKIKDLANIFIEEDIEQIILTGSGDSYCAALYGSYLGKNWCPNINVQHYAPFEFVNYFNHKKDLKNSAIIGISVSGGTLRVIESIRYAKQYGAKTIAITDNPQGKLIKETQCNLLIQASPPESVQLSSYESEVAKQYIGYHHDCAQTKTYLANLAVLSVLMAYISPKSENNLSSIQEAFSLVEKGIENHQSFINIGNTLKDSTDNVFFVASGSNNATSLFGSYKMFEFALNGFACDIEEYCHTNYFITTDKSSVVFIAPDRLSLNRIMEIEPVLRDVIEAKTIILVANELKNEAGPHSIPILSPNEVVLSPLIFTVPIEFLTYSLAKNKGLNTNIFRGGQETIKYVTGSFKTIRQSKLRY
ncbi:MAG: SIS domain-containing protein [Candidatus Hodarchaeota archaeon]